MRKPESTYNLQINGEQAHLLSTVLDMFVRMGLGQLENTAEMLTRLHSKDYPMTDREKNSILDAMLEIKQRELGFTPNASWGIGGQIHEDARVAYDLMKVVQQAIAKNEEHGAHSVWHDGDLVHYGKQPTATCEVEN